MIFATENHKKITKKIYKIKNKKLIFKTRFLKSGKED